MPEFQTHVDIANRALQHCGAPQIDTNLGFTEQSKRARETSSCIGKLRRAELQRNIWRFATRRTALRPIDTDTMLLAPTLWASTATYFVDSVVSDQSGTLWLSKRPNNLGNDPQNSPQSWEPYFGPLTVDLYDSTKSYLVGEVVYTAAGNSTYNVYLSRLGGNVVHPALPNQWSATARYSQNQVVQQFAAYAGGTTYSAGQSVSYTDGNIYASLTGSNTGNTPPSSPTRWAAMPVLTLSATSPTSSPINEWSQATTYALGSFVVFAGSVYVAIAGSNTGNFPNASGSTFWAVTTGGTLYMSLYDLNIGNSPASAPALWSNSTTYSTGNKVGGSNGAIYSSVGNGNVNHDPVSDGGVHWTNTGVANPWTTVFVQGGGNSLWTQIGGAAFPNGAGLSELNILYPVNCGPTSQAGTRNVCRLPAGYLRRAPQDPKAGSSSYLGAPAGLAYPDWEFERNFLVTAEVDAIIFRFVADIQDVTQFDDMFCEGLACRVALEVCEPLTQSTAKLGAISSMYKQMMGEARTVNAIETGSDEPPLDDYLACRA